MTSFSRHATPPPGAIFRRCACKGDNGKQLGKHCPKLATDPAHGTWTYRLVIPADHNGVRRQIKRSGHASEQAAIEAWRDMHHAARSGVARARMTTWRSRNYLIAARAMLAEDVQLLKLSGTTAGTVYAFLAAPYVKIGYTQDVRARLGFMKNKGHTALTAPEDVDFGICQPWRGVAGNRDDERAVQHLARNYWVAGEWYWADPGLIEVLKGVLNLDLRSIRHTPRTKTLGRQTGTGQPSTPPGRQQ